VIHLATANSSNIFFQVVNTRYERGHPTIVTTNRGLPDWGTIFGDTVVAAAVLDGLMHNAVVFNIKRPSWRPREHNGPEIATTNPTERRPSDLHRDPDAGRRRAARGSLPIRRDLTDPRVSRTSSTRPSLRRPASSRAFDSGTCRGFATVGGL
jgi:hypothetical protein